MTALRLPLVLVATSLPTLVNAQFTPGFPMEPAKPAIAVSGVAEIRVVPDEVVHRFAVEDRGGAAAAGETEQKLAAGMISVTSRVDVVFTLE